jgi:hypothetical protein
MEDESEQEAYKKMNQSAKPCWLFLFVVVAVRRQQGRRHLLLQ